MYRYKLGEYILVYVLRVILLVFIGLKIMIGRLISTQCYLL